MRLDKNYYDADFKFEYLISNFIITVETSVVILGIYFQLTLT